MKSETKSVKCLENIRKRKTENSERNQENIWKIKKISENTDQKQKSPNLIVGDDVSPLRKVITFARNPDVARMRGLLLAYGASESVFERQRQPERRAADACDAAWLENYHRSTHQPYAATAVSTHSDPRPFVQCR